MSRMYRVIFGGLVLALAGSFGVSAWAKSPFWGCPVPQCPPSAPTPPAAAGEAATRTPGTEPAAPQAGEGAFAQAPAAGTGAESTGNPNMMGDFLPA